MKRRMNLLYVFADQWRGSALGYDGSDPVVTPHMDEFCRESVYCDHAYSTFPLCSPHRASLLTGRYPLSTGFFTNCKTGLSMRLLDEELGIAQVLKEQGYETAYIGKWHLDEPEVNHHPRPVSGARAWDAYTPPGIRRHGFDYWHSYGAWDAHLHPHYWEDSPEMKQVDQWSVEHETDVALHYIAKAAKGKEPFALYLSWNPPHSPYDQVPDEYFKRYRDKALDFKGNVRVEGLHHHTGEEVGYTEEELMTATKQYYAAVSGLDDQFSRLIKMLKDTGIYEDTLIILSADHGDMMGSQGLIGKHVWYEESIRIPLVVRIPGCSPHACSTCIGSQDQMPTLLGLLGVPVPDSVEGEDCSEILLSQEENPDKACFLEACPGRELFLKEFLQEGLEPMGYGWRGIRTNRYTYVLEVGYKPNPKPAVIRYLYDNQRDPLQLSPLQLETEKNGKIGRELEKRVMDWMEKQKDPFILNQS